MGSANEESGSEAVAMLQETIRDIAKIANTLDKGVQADMAVDIELRFKGVTVEKNGRFSIARRRKIKESEIELNLATQVIIRRRS